MKKAARRVRVSITIAGVRKMLFANLYDQREVDLVAVLCKQEGVTISDLMRRAIAGMCDEQGIERPAGVFDDRGKGQSGRPLGSKSQRGIGKRGRPRNEDVFSKVSFMSQESK